GPRGAGDWRHLLAGPTTRLARGLERRGRGRGRARARVDRLLLAVLALAGRVNAEGRRRPGLFPLPDLPVRGRDDPGRRVPVLEPPPLRRRALPGPPA